MAGDYSIEDIYSGGYSSLKPEYGSLFTGYRADVSTLGQATSPFTTNIIQEVSEKLRPGQKVVEVSMGIFPDRAPIEAIPKQHIDEVRRQAKLAGVEITVHGPLLDPSGFAGREGFDEQEREIAERKILQALEKGYQISPNANVPVTFHSANSVPGAKYNKTKKGEEILMMPIVNQETGQLNIVKKEEKFYPGEKGMTRTVQQELNSINNSEWINSLTNIEHYKKEADEIISKAMIPLAPILTENENLNEINLTPEQRSAYNQLQRATIFLDNVQSSFNSLYNKAYKFSGDAEREKLKKISDDWKKRNEEIMGEMKSGKLNPISVPFRDSQILDDSILKIKEIYNSSKVPQIYRPAEDYAMEKSTQTFGNAAFEAYKKFGNKAPIISIENPPAGFGLSRAEDLKKMVEGSRDQFVKNATEKLGMSKKQAEREAEKLIGVTWDVGHINQLRKFGFSGKDIIKEAEKIAPYLKHVHLSDNFGMENIELPMGMGNVDFKEVMEKLGKKGEKAKKITEAGNWWTTFKESPMASTLQALGSSVYGMNMAPYWNQAMGAQGQSYFSYGLMLPQINYETFGAGFSNLPSELGGQRQGGQGSRMSGRGME